MKRQTIVSALALIGTLVFAGCSGGGGAGSASANGCGGGGYGGSGTVYPANVPYSVPFSSQAVSGTLQFPADQSCHLSRRAVGNIEYAGTASSSNSVTLTSMLLRYTDLGNNYFAITTR
jgi:hypothetical protein